MGSGGIEVFRRNGMVALVVIATFFASSCLVVTDSESSAVGWTDGDDRSNAYPNYGIHDLIANQTYTLLLAHNSSKARFLTHWYLEKGADANDVSFDSRNRLPQDDDNFLAWTDDVPDGDGEYFFVNNLRDPFNPPATDAPIESQRLVTEAVQSLTQWFLRGSVDGDEYQHMAAYKVGKLAHYVGDMSQYGHTDYSKWEHVGIPPERPPLTSPNNEFIYMKMYEAIIWDDEAMDSLIDEFESREFHLPSLPSCDETGQIVSDLAIWVNGRGQDPVTMSDDPDNPPGIPPQEITAGYNYERMNRLFRENWNQTLSYRNVDGFDESLWELTMENIIAATENLTAIYISIWDEAWGRFLQLSPDLKVINWTVDPDPVIAGDNVIVNVTLKNYGVGPAGVDPRPPFDVAITTSHGFHFEKSLSLLPGEEKNVTFPQFPVGTEGVDLIFEADSRKSVVEANEDDNMYYSHIEPLPEEHGVEVALGAAYLDPRRDTVKPLVVRIENTGNRYDLYLLEGISTIPGVSIETSGERIGICSGKQRDVALMVNVSADAPTGQAYIDISALGFNSTNSFRASFSIIERTTDPIPRITGHTWARRGDNVTLSASSSSDPDGDPITFIWVLPEYGNLTDEEVTVKYEVPGTYNIYLYVFDGNATSFLHWPLIIYPDVPENLSIKVDVVGVSGVTLSWDGWNAGGLIAYWLNAEAFPGQDEKSNRGPYILRVDPGNITGRIGKFYPDTRIKISFGVEAQRFGNETLETIEISTDTTAQFISDFRLFADKRELKIHYKPWIDPEGEREPIILAERMYAEEFVTIEPSLMEVTSQTKLMDRVNFPLGSSTGIYRVTLTYNWRGEGKSPFGFWNQTGVPNIPPQLRFVGFEYNNWSLGEEGEPAAIKLYLSIKDPDDTIKISLDWGDRSPEESIPDFLHFEEESLTYRNITHNYTELGDYTLSVKAVDWGGHVTWLNTTIVITEWEGFEKKKEESLFWNIVLTVVFSVILAGIIVAMGIVGYRFAKKDTEVEIDLEKLKAKRAPKVGTGTDFDKRQSLQIPKESIMGGAKRSSILREPEPEESGGKGTEEPPVSEKLPPKANGKNSFMAGKATFDEEE